VDIIKDIRREGMDWIDLAQDRGQQKALKALMAPGERFSSI
jgi:hypothetical protein